MTSLPYHLNIVYPATANPSGLLNLLAYAMAHQHSRPGFLP